jgi:hypothetical protein
MRSECCHPRGRKRDRALTGSDVEECIAWSDVYVVSDGQVEDLRRISVGNPGENIISGCV